MMTMTTMKRSRLAPYRLACQPALLVVAFGLVFSGCDDAVNQSDTVQIETLQKRLISESVLEDEQMVSEVRKQLLADGVEKVEVVLKGRINAGKEALPWETGKAAFVLTDAIGHEGEKDHDPHTCPFCSRNINDYLVMVSFLDDAGQLIDIDSRKLFDVTEKQLVYVKGTARIDADDDLLYLDAVKLHAVTDQ